MCSNGRALAGLVTKGRHSASSGRKTLPCKWYLSESVLASQPSPHGVRVAGEFNVSSAPHRPALA